MEVITYEIPQKVRVRKYSVDYERLCELLRRHKKTSGLSNKAIAESLNVPITKVEHWFRQDSSFAIPDEELWIKIKELLQIDSTEFDESTLTFVEKESVFEKGNRIYDSVGIAPTITCGDAGLTILERMDELEVKQIGNIMPNNNRDNPNQGRVYDRNGLSPTLTDMQGGGRQPMIVDKYNIPCITDRTVEGGKSFGSVDDLKLKNIGTEVGNAVLSRYWKGIEGSNSNAVIVAMRGRNPENPSDRTVGSPTEQRLEPNSQGICNTLTSVQKDNLVMEKVCYIDEQNMNIQNDVVGTLTTDGSSPKHNNRVLETVRIKQATKEGYIECKVGGVADLLYPSSTTRRGRVQDNGDVSPTITSMENGLYKIESQYRIRKLTPKECWSLMNFSESDFNKAAEVNSNTQLYKQAGNSIVKNVLVAIFGQMIPGKENVYKEINRKEME